MTEGPDVPPAVPAVPAMPLPAPLAVPAVPEVRDPRNVAYKGASDEVAPLPEGERAEGRAGGKGGKKGGKKGKGKGGKATEPEVVPPRKKDGRVYVFVDDALGEAEGSDGARVPLVLRPTYGSRKFVCRLADDAEGRIRKYFRTRVVEPSQEYCATRRELKGLHELVYERLVKQAFHHFHAGRLGKSDADAAARNPVFRAILGRCVFSNATPQEWLYAGAQVEPTSLAAACNNIEVDTAWKPELKAADAANVNLSGFTKAAAGAAGTGTVHQLKGFRLTSGRRVDLDLEEIPGDGPTAQVRLISAQVSTSSNRRVKVTDCVRAGFGPMRRRMTEDEEGANDEEESPKAADDKDSKDRGPRQDFRIRSGFAPDMCEDPEVKDFMKKVFVGGGELYLPVGAAMATHCYRKKCHAPAAGEEAAAKDAFLGIYTKGLLTLTLSKVHQHDDPDEKPAVFYYGEIAAPALTAMLEAGAAQPDAFSLRDYAAHVYRFVAECFACLGWGDRAVDAAEEEALYKERIEEKLIKQVEKLEAGPAAWLAAADARAEAAATAGAEAPTVEAATDAPAAE